MSTPIAMSLPQPLMAASTLHNTAAARPPTLDTTSPVTNNPNSLSPSNHSSQSSSLFPQPSTAATSPVSSFNNSSHHHHQHQHHHHHHPSAFNPTLNLHPPSTNPHAVTRILLLSDFSKDLKTRDIQLVFADWEDERGGFKIKWIDDTSCLIVFADPGVAKRAFVSVLSNPPSSLVDHSDSDGQGVGRVARLRAYNGPDVPNILASVQNRPRSRSTASQSLHSRASSLASNHTGILGKKSSIGAIPSSSVRHRTSFSSASGQSFRQPNPPSHLQDVIDHINPTTANASLSGPDPAAEPAGQQPNGLRARIDDAGKRFIAAGLGKPNGSVGGPLAAPDIDGSITYSLADLTIEEEAATPTAASH